MVDYRIVVPSGIVFDFNNMLGAGRLKPQEVEQALQQQGAVAEKGLRLTVPQGPFRVGVST